MTITKTEAGVLVAAFEIIKAFAAGKTIQVENNYGEWLDVNRLDLDGPFLNYRIKPSPRRWWIRAWQDGRTFTLCQSKNEGDGSVGMNGGTLIEVVEVIK